MNYDQRSTTRTDAASKADLVLADHISSADYSLRDLLRVISRRRKWIIGSAALLFIAAIFYNHMERPVYEATATIELNKSSGTSVDLGVGNLMGDQLTGGGDLQTDLQTETSILQGDSLALAVIQNLHLTSQEPFLLQKAGQPQAELPLERDPARRTQLLAIFKSHLQITPVRQTRLIQVTFTSHDPEQAATVANAIIESYKAQYLQSHYDATKEASGWLTMQLSELKQNVEESEKKLTDFEKQSGFLNVPSLGEGAQKGAGEVHSTVIQKLDMLNTELTTAEANTIAKEAVYRLASSGSEDAILGLGQNPIAMQSGSIVLSQGGGLDTLRQLRQQKNNFAVEIAKASSIYGVNNRHLKELQTQADAVESQIHSEIKTIVQSAHGDYLLAKQTEDNLRQQFNQQQTEASMLNEKAVELAMLSEEAYSRKKLYEDLYSQLQEANVAAGIHATNISTIDPARPESIPVSPKRIRNYGIGLSAGLFLGIALAFVVDSLDSSVISPLDVESITSLPVLGIVPVFREDGKMRRYFSRGGREDQTGASQNSSSGPSNETAAGDQLWVLKHPNSPGAEAIRAVRTSILLSRPGGGPRVLLVTSCLPGEGKSTISANLAISYAQHNKKVIIVEADMRRPTMKHVVGVSGATGLSNILSGTHTFEQVVVRGVALPGLDVLPAGPRPPLPSELLAAEAFDGLLNRLRETYDVVIIDSPPALLLTDAVVIAFKVDAAIWVVLSGVIKRQQLARAAQLIERNRIPMIGFVLNRVDSSADSYGYDYKYYGAYAEEENSND